MNSLHSLQQNLLMAGTTYGWRLDAILVAGVLSILMAALAEAQRCLASPNSRLASARA